MKYRAQRCTEPAHACLAVHQPRRSLVAACLLLWLASTSILAENRATADAEIALVTTVRGLVTVRHPDEPGYALASRAYLLTKGMMVQTGADGFASLRFVDSRTRLTLRPQSAVILRSSRSGKRSTKTIAINAGSVVCNMGEDAQGMVDVSTPTALVGLGGGITLVLVSKNTNETTVYNLGQAATIADNECRRWLDIPTNAAAFATSKGVVHVSPASPEEIVRVAEIAEMTEQLKHGPPLVHDLTVKASANGTVSPDGRMAVLAGVGVDIAAAAQEGYLFAGWNVIDGAARIADVSAESTHVVVAGNTVVEAAFTAKPCRLVIKTAGNGHTDPSGTLDVRRESPVTIRVIADSGHEFVGWKTSSNVRLSEQNFPFTTASLSANTGTVTAQFAQKKYRLRVQATENGSVMPKKQVTALHAVGVDIAAVAAPGFRFVQWSVREGAATVRDPRSAQTQVVCDSLDAVIEAEFSDNTVEVSILPHERAQVSPHGSFHVVRNSVLEVAAVPDDGFKVEKWDVVRGRAAVRGYEEADIKCRTPFEIQPIVVTKTYDLTLLSNAYGKTMPNRTVRIPHGAAFAIQAVPNTGMHFIRWKTTGGWATIENSQDSATIMTLTRGPAVLLAECAPTICSLKVETTPGGYTEPGGVLKNFEGGEIFIKAVPNPKAAFVMWEVLEGADNVTFSDTATVAEQTITSRTGRASIRAVFSTEAVELTVLSDGLGRTDPDGKVFVVKDQWTPIRALAEANQPFVQWTILSGTNASIKDQFQAETEISTLENCTVKAFFSGSGTAGSGGPGTGSGPYTLKVLFDDNRGSVAQGAEMTIQAGMPEALTASAKPGYYFGMWRVKRGTPVVTTPYMETTTIVLTGGDATVEAVFLNRPAETLEIRFKDYQGRTKTISSRYRK